MATCDEVPFGAISQQTLGMKEGWVAADSGVPRKKMKAGAKGKRGEGKGNDSESIWTAWQQKRLCAPNEEGFVYFSLQQALNKELPGPRLNPITFLCKQ